jgi:hypothetical protein
MEEADKMTDLFGEFIHHRQGRNSLFFNVPTWPCAMWHS